jgi:hypothetical protein
VSFLNRKKELTQNKKCTILPFFAKFAGSGEDFFKKKISMNFLLICYYLPLEKGYPLHLNKLESTLPKDDLCQ